MTEQPAGRIDRKTFLRAGAGVALGAGFFGAAGGGTSFAARAARASGSAPKAKVDGDLNFFNWSQYLSPAVIKAFEKEYKVKVHQTFFDNMQGMMTKLRAGVRFDVTFPTNDFAYLLVKAGMLAPIDHSALRNWGQVPQPFHNPWYDPQAAHTVPYAIWTTGIAWRSDRVGGMTGSWNDLWNHPKAKGKIFLLDDFQEALGMSLLRLRHDINSTDRGQLHDAASALLKLKPMLRGISTDDITNLVSGSAWIHHAWSGDVWQVLQQVKNPEDFRYETAREGVPTGNDTMVIPKNAEHPGTALLFIDWMLEPEHAAQNVRFFGYPQVTKSGLSAFDALVKKYPFLAVTLKQAQHGDFFRPLSGSNLQLWQSEWTRVKA